MKEITDERLAASGERDGCFVCGERATADTLLKTGGLDEWHPCCEQHMNESWDLGRLCRRHLPTGAH